MRILISVLITIQAYQVQGFTFASLSVSADSQIINTFTDYQINFNRAQDDNQQPTPYLTNLIKSTDNVIINFPSVYSLTSISCLVSINQGNI